MGQVRDAIFELAFEVGLPEEAAVVEAGAEDTFVAALDQTFRVSVSVHDGNKLGSQFAGFCFKRKVALMVAHYGHQDFAGKLEEFGIEGADDRRRPFGHIGQSAGELYVEFRSAGLDERRNAIVAGVGAQFGEVVAELLFVGVDGDCDVFLAEDAMPLGGVAGLHAFDREGNNFIAEQRDEPADGTDKPGSAFSVPIHRFGPGGAEDQTGQRLGENFLRLAALHLLPETEVFTLWRRFGAELVGRGAHFPGETVGGSGSGGFRRPQQQLFGVGLLRDELLDEEGEAARRGVGSGDHSAEAVLVDQFLKAVLEVIQRGGDHPIGDFFGTDFEEKWDAHAAASLCWSTQSCAAPTAIFRTRAMTPTRSVTEMAPRESRRLNKWEHFSACS